MAKVPVISIVDDDRSVREATGCLVRSLGYVARTFASGEEFLGSGCVNETSFLIVDAKLSPDLSGTALHAALVSRGYCVPTIFISACRDEQFRAQIARTGAMALLSKPVCERTLMEHLRTGLKDYQADDIQQ